MSKEIDQKPTRTAQYRKNPRAEQILEALNERLVPLERGLVADFIEPRYPTIFIVGAPRSGTTLLSQLLITYFELGYINNVIARFWMAPYVGAWLASELQNFGRPPAIGFESDLGTTSECEGLHEFGYFWRRWFQYGDTHELDKGQLGAIDTPFLRQELAAIESVFDRPLLFKNVAALSLRVGFLATTLPKSLFIHCRRDPAFTAQSLLVSRLKYYGSRETWFSIKPQEYSWLKERPYEEQIAGQIFHTRQRIEQAFETMSSTRYVNLDYESLCNRPSEQLASVAQLVEGVGHRLVQRDVALPNLSSTNKQVIDDDEFQRLETAYHRISRDVGSE